MAIKDLEKNFDEVLEHLKKEKFNIFYSKNITEEGILPEINWENQDNSWKEFFSIAKKENINTIIVEKENFDKQFLENIENLMQNKIDEDSELNKRFNEFFQGLKKYENQLGAFIFSWIKDGARYSFSEKTSWLDEIENGLSEIKLLAKQQGGYRHRVIEDRDELPKEISKKPVEEWAEEFYNYLQKDFPNASRHDIYTAEHVFWEEKGVDRYGGKARVLMDKVSNIIQRKLEAKEKEMIPKLVGEGIKWAKDNELKKMTKSNIIGFIAEKGLNLSSNSKDILYNRINLKLKQEE